MNVPSRLSRLAVSGFAALLLLAIIAKSVPSARGADVGVRLMQPYVDRVQHYRFSIAATVGQAYPIEVSQDLIHWFALRTVVAPATGTLWIDDEEAPNLQLRFYHVGTHIPNMVFIEPGSFTMGSPATEANRRADEGPQTIVNITRGFWMAKYEVTQVDYVAVTGENNSVFSADWRYPVDFVNWNQATNYCHKLNEREAAAGRLPAGYAYRLPTEAEWEYACRAGNTTAFGLGNGTSLSSTQANFDGNFPAGGGAVGPYINRTTVPGSYPPNAWGLYDMHGNVWEWCQDAYATYPGGTVTDPTGSPTAPNRILRGGSYNSAGHGCRSAKRDNRLPTYANVGQGIRVVLARVL
jgi:formylglycine-generating enzyme required for sulfatase activity